ncbi:MAG TPA: hypothetical protein DCZ71_06215 [Ruminococcus sp.]|nr:hypothetical protein [Ruminococcus sp.]
MYLLLIAGIIAVLMGLALVFAGIRQGMDHISSEENFTETEGYVIDIKSRLTACTIHYIPVIAREYSAVIQFRTDGGEDVTASMPFIMKSSPAFADYRASLENGVPLPVKYDPEDPQNCFCGDNRGFRVRETVYRIIAAVPVLLIGYALIWWHFNI